MADQAVSFIVRDDLVRASGQLATVQHIVLPAWAWLLRDESHDPAWGTIEFGPYVIAYRVTL